MTMFALRGLTCVEVEVAFAICVVGAAWLDVWD